MNFDPCDIPDVYLITPRVFDDPRGYFFESYRQDLFEQKIGSVKFVQDNESRSNYGVLRGLHYQLPPFEQSKLIRVIEGEILDVAVDIRRHSPTFGKHIQIQINSRNKHQLFIPRGFAHGFLVLSEYVIFHYRVDNYYSKEHERGIRFDDPQLNLHWEIPSEQLQLSKKDEILPLFDQAELPDYQG